MRNICGPAYIREYDPVSYEVIRSSFRNKQISHLNKLDKIFEKDLEEAKTELKKINS